MISSKTPLEDIKKLSAQNDSKLAHIEPAKRGTHLCVYGSGTCADSDLPKLAKFLRVTIDELKDKYLEQIEKFGTTKYRPKLLKQGNNPHGRCIFLSQDMACTVHDAKPLQCEISHFNHNSEDISKWFDFHNFVKPNNPHSIREYALWLQFNTPLPGAELENLVPDKKLLNKILDFAVIK